MDRAQLKETHPGTLFIDELEPEAMGTLLEELLGLESVSSCSITQLGDGNMNLTRRVHIDGKDYAVKQSVPWVAKYPQIEAPWDRTIREASFYQACISNKAVRSRMPRLLATDLARRILVFQFIPKATDGSAIYDPEEVMDHGLGEQLGHFLAALHHTPIDPKVSPMLTNRDMRTLNFEHIFDLPFRPDIDLELDAHCPGLQDLARRIKSDGRLHRKATQLGNELYLSDGAQLIHGDFFPGSWLFTGDKVWIIDAEFAFLGNGIFDLAVAKAHLELAGKNELFGHLLAGYLNETIETPDEKTLETLSAIEVLRRLIGVAQLDLDYDLKQRSNIVEEAAEKIWSY